MGLCEVPLSISLMDFWMGTILANFHMCGIMLVLRAVLNILVRNAGQREPMCFKCMKFSLSVPCELLIFTLFYCLLDLSCGECNVLSLYFPCLTVFGETIPNIFGCDCYVVVECYWYWSSSSSCHQTAVFHCSTHCFAVSLNCRRSSKEQECARSGHSNICLVSLVRHHSHM